MEIIASNIHADFAGNIDIYLQADRDSQWEHVNFARTNELIGSDRNESKSSQKLILTQQ